MFDDCGMEPAEKAGWGGLTTTTDILTAIEALALEGVPQLEAIYRDAVPKHFLRPCLLLEPVSTTTADASASLVLVSEYVTLVVYGALDDFGNSDSGQLLDLRRQVQALFRPGFLKVGERAIGVQTSTGGFAWDRAWLDLQMEYHDNRSEALDGTPLMESIQARINNTKE